MLLDRRRPAAPLHRRSHLTHGRCRSALFHTIAIGHRAYGFPYDDVNDQSSVAILPDANPPSSLTITVGW
ncbi:MAG: beta-1,3-glucanase family protein [Solirubrobacteraceae bacterium]